MRVYLYILLLISGMCFSQNAPVKSTDKFVEMIDTHLKNGSLKQKELGHASVLGGTLTGYYLGKKLVFMRSSYGGPFGQFDHLFYLENDSLVFAIEKKIILKEPESTKEYEAYENYVIFNTDKAGKTDLSKWPLLVNLNNTYYFDHGKIIKYQLKSFDKIYKPQPDQLESSAGDLSYRCKTQYRELNPDQGE